MERKKKGGRGRGERKGGRECVGEGKEEGRERKREKEKKERERGKGKGNQGRQGSLWEVPLRVASP